MTTKRFGRCPLAQREDCERIEQEDSACSSSRHSQQAVFRWQMIWNTKKTRGTCKRLLVTFPAAWPCSPLVVVRVMWAAPTAFHDRFITAEPGGSLNNTYGLHGHTGMSSTCEPCSHHVGSVIFCTAEIVETDQLEFFSR